MNKNIYLFFLLGIISCAPKNASQIEWKTLKTKGQPTARHEAGFVACNEKLYLLGGRRINPTSVFDPKTKTWTEQSAPPIELHHFQPVVFKNAIYILGAMTGGWPNETPVDKIVIYHPEKDEFVFGDKIPEHRRRGGAGCVVYKDKIYLVGGITEGHITGYKNWMDEYDPATGKWRTLPNAPSARDHFQAVVVDDKLYTFAGRNTSKLTGQDMALNINHGNVFDFKTEAWAPVQNYLQIPTGRAGNSIFAHKGNIIVGGGESGTQVKAHNEVEAFNPTTKTWTTWKPMNEGRHGTGFAVVGDYVYTASGCGNRGGKPELTTIERMKLPKKNLNPSVDVPDETPVFTKWHTVTLSFEGPKTSENDEHNPFLNYALEVKFKHAKSQKTIRGFYAADGNAGETSAESGNIWQVRFTPEHIGKWSYSAKLVSGDSIALENDLSDGKVISINNSKGNFLVVPTDKAGSDFRAKGRVVAGSKNFRFKSSKEYLLKMGANSPENFLGYHEFDGTYRMSANNREGEAKATGEIHKFDPHLKDWKTGDPTWKNGKGKAIVGAVNYLASKRMNSIYFLTMNINGDGKDVWPYQSPDDFTRFDVSRLEQWEVLFQHIQSKGILLHMVLQETENELLLDGGETGPMRQLYYRELIARFGHHLGLIWNLGEENGPAHWFPTGQNNRQRIAMAKFFHDNDPYNHPVLIHTHSDKRNRAPILDSLVSSRHYFDGLSFQHYKRETAPENIHKWLGIASGYYNDWLISMDEIGMWHTGALTDTADVDHTSLRRYVLWGSLMSGAAGVEWYFGARHVHNDLTSEDWRQRDRLWELTDIAHQFFQKHLPYWKMGRANHLISMKEAYCFATTYKEPIFAIYLPERGNCTLNLNNIKRPNFSRNLEGNYKVSWYDPLKGGDLQQGSIVEITGGGIRDLGLPPKEGEQDWVILVEKI